MANKKQPHNWGKVKPGDIISFRYKPKSGNPPKTQTILVLNPRLNVTLKDGKTTKQLIGIKLEESNKVSLRVNKKQITLLEQIGDFVKFHHPKMIGLTGSKDQIDQVSRVYKTYYKAQRSNDDLYLVDHSTLTYLILTEYGFVEFFRRDKSADEIANITACFIENS